MTDLQYLPIPRVATTCHIRTESSPSASLLLFSSFNADNYAVLFSDSLAILCSLAVAPSLQQVRHATTGLLLEDWMADRRKGDIRFDHLYFVIQESSKHRTTVQNHGQYRSYYRHEYKLINRPRIPMTVPHLHAVQYCSILWVTEYK